MSLGKLQDRQLLHQQVVNQPAFVYSCSQRGVHCHLPETGNSCHLLLWQSCNLINQYMFNISLKWLERSSFSHQPSFWRLMLDLYCVTLAGVPTSSLVVPIPVHLSVLHIFIYFCHLSWLEQLDTGTSFGIYEVPYYVATDNSGFNHTVTPL